METNIRLWSYLAQFFLEWKIFQTSVVEKIETHVLCFENHAFYEIVWKNNEERGRPHMT
jgi:hypothetical protein